MTEDEMVRWHHQLNGREFEQALGTGDRQASLGDCRGLPAPLQSMGGHKESDMIELIEVEGWSQILF